MTYSIANIVNANTVNQQYVKIKGSIGETDEIRCNANFDVINRDVICTFDSDVEIGEYQCVVLRTGGNDGLDLRQVNIWGGDNHFFVFFVFFV